MGDVVNLNKARKTRARQERQAQAEANRVRHGLTKAERQKTSKEAEAVARDHEGKRLD